MEIIRILSVIAAILLVVSPICADVSTSTIIHATLGEGNVTPTASPTPSPTTTYHSGGGGSGGGGSYYSSTTTSPTVNTTVTTAVPTTLFTTVPTTTIVTTVATTVVTLTPTQIVNVTSDVSPQIGEETTGILIAFGIIAFVIILGYLMNRKKEP